MNASLTCHLLAQVIDRFFVATYLVHYAVFKWAVIGLFFVHFRSFQNKITIFATFQSEKMSIQYLVLRLKPMESESLLITTRPGLPLSKPCYC